MLVVVVEHSVQAGGAQVQQGVVGCLLLLATGVAIEEVVDLVGNFWAGGQGLVSGVQEMSTRTKPTRTMLGSGGTMRHIFHSRYWSQDLSPGV